MQESQDLQSGTTKGWVDKIPGFLKAVFWIAVVIGGLAIFVQVANAFSKFVDDVIRLAFAWVEPWTNWFLYQVWEPATPTARVIIVGLGIVIALLVLRELDSHTKKPGQTS